MKNVLDSEEMAKMRQQLSLLNKKLENEVIVNERLMKRIMSDNVSKLNRDSKLLIVVSSLIGIPCWFFIWNEYNFSVWFGVVTILFFIVSAIHTFYTNRGINPQCIQTGNLVCLGENLYRMKRLNRNWLGFSLPFLVLWIASFFYQLSLHITDYDMFVNMAIWAGVGLVVGAVIGVKHYIKTQRLASELLEQIKDLTDLSEK